jgi:hypothetical protein
MGAYFENPNHNQGSLGFFADGTLVRWVSPSSPAAEAGIRPGDRLAHPETIRERLEHFRYQPPERRFNVLLQDRPVTLRTIRARPVSAPVQVLILVRCITYLIFLFVGFRLVYLRPIRMYWALFLYCVFSGAPYNWTEAYVELPTPLWWIIKSFWIASAFAASIGFLSFALRFPRGEVAGWRGALERASLRAAPLFFGVVLLWWPLETLGYLRWRVDLFVVAIPICILLVSTWSLLTYYRAAAGVDHRRLAIVIIGVCLGNFALLARIFVQNVQGGLLHRAHGDVVSRIFGIATVILPLAVLYASRARVLLDASELVSPTVLAFLGAALVIALNAVLEKIGKYISGEALSQPLASTFFSVVIVALLTPFGDVLKRWTTSKGNGDAVVRLKTLCDQLTFIAGHKAVYTHLKNSIREITGWNEVVLLLSAETTRDGIRAGDEPHFSKDDAWALRVQQKRGVVVCSEESTTRPMCAVNAKYVFPLLVGPKLIGLLFLGDSAGNHKLPDGQRDAIADVCRTCALVVMTVSHEDEPGNQERAA